MKNSKDFGVSIIIPAFNEEGTIGEVIRRIQNVNWEWQILVINDGSDDETAKIAKAAGAKVLNHPYNIGLGGCLKNGARVAKGDIFVFIDGDGQHPPEDIPRLLEAMDEYDMAVGVRSLSQQLTHRAFGNRIFSWVANRLSGHKVPDLTSGFRAIRRECFMEFIHLLPNRYSSATTLTLAMLKAGLFVRFIPVSDTKLRERDKSGIRPLRDGINILSLIVRIIMLFNPNKFFLPIGGGLVGVGCLFGALQLLNLGGIRGSTIIFIVTGILILMFGLCADQISNIRLGLQRPPLKKRGNELEK